MARFYSRPEPPVKPTRRTANAPHAFGAGILRYVRHVGRVAYSEQDEREAAQMFGDVADAARKAADEPDSHWDELAAQRAWEDRHEAWAAAGFGRCMVCSETCDYLTAGLCGRCEENAENDSVACRNQSVGLGRRVF